MHDEFERLQQELRELREANAELRDKVQQLTVRQGEFVSLLSRLDVAALFLDGSLRLQRYTPQATSLFRINGKHLGQDLETIPTLLQDADLLEDCRLALKDNLLVEREVEATDGSTHVLRIIPDLAASKASGESLVLTFQNITLRKQREEELRRAYERLNLAQKVSHTGCFDRDFSTGEGYWSDEIYRIFGYEPGEVEGTHDFFLQQVHPEDLPGVQAAIQESQKTGRVFDKVYRFRKRDGSIAWAHSLARVIHDENGQAQSINGTFQDVTQQKEREEELRLAYERLNQAQEVALVGTFDRNLVTGEGYWSDQIYRLFGYEVSTVNGFQERFFWHVHPDDVQAVQQALDDVMAGTRPYDVRFRYHTLQGDLRWGHSLGRVERDANGTPVRLFGTFQDITQRKAIEHSLQVERERLDIALEATGAGVYEIAIPLDGHVYRSPMWFRIHGIDPQDVPQKQEAFYEWYASRIAEPGLSTMRQVLKEYSEGQRESHNEIYHYQAPSGDWLWIQSVARKMQNPDGSGRLVGAAMDVTARVEAEQELRDHRDHLQELVRRGNRELARSEALHRTVIEHFPNGSVVVFDHDMRYQLAGGEALSLVGLTAEELVGRTVYEVFEPDFATVLVEMFQRALDGEFVATEIEYGGDVFEVSVLPVRDDQNEIVAGMAQSQRITERRTMERAQHEQNQLYRNLVANAPDIIARFDSDFRIEFVNEAIERYTRRPIESFLGLGLDILELEPQERETFLDALRAAFATGEERIVQISAMLDDQRYSFHIRLAPERDVSGAVQSMLCIARDITGLFSLQRERERLLELIEATPDLVFTMSAEGCVAYSNRAALEILGLSGESADHHWDCESIYPEKEFEKLLEVFMPHAREQGFWSGETLLSCREGKLLPVKQTVVSQRLDEEQGELFSVIAHDLSELKKRESELQKAKEHAEEANRSKSDFLANMSHELRTPITGILGMTELLLRDPTVRGVRDKLEMVSQAGSSLLAIINDVLDLSKIEARGLEIEEEDFPLERLVQNVEGMFLHQAQSKNLAFSIHVDDSLSQWLYGDEQRIGQVLRNLISNAIKFTKQGSVSLYVQLVAERSAGMDVAFSVRDTGIGIPQEEQHRLFTSFTQLDSSYAKKHGGTGLGLAISKQLVELMGGEMDMQSAPGEGSRFSFTLPLKHSQKQEETAAESSPRAQALAKKLRVLAVDDNTINRVYLGGVLDDFGFESRLAEDGDAALQALEEERFDCILMDVQMPGKDGVEVTRIIRESDTAYRRVPIIALTAYAMKGDRERFLQAGMNEYVAKPVEGNELLEAIQHALEAAGADHKAVQDEASPPDAEAHSADLEGFEALVAQEHRRLEARLQTIRQGELLCEEFLKEAGKKHQAIQDAWQESDERKLADLAHSLAGAAGVLGLKGLMHQARLLDKKVMDGDATVEAADVEELLQRLEVSRLAVEAVLGKDAD